MDTQGVVGGVHVWTHMVVGEYMYGHTGGSGGSTCMDIPGIVGEYMY